MPIRHLFQRPPRGELTFARTPPELRSRALSAATGQAVALIAGFERRAGARGMDLSLLWSAHTESGEIAASVLVVPSPGRTAATLFCVGPNGDDVSLSAAVLRQACQDLKAEGSLSLLQSLPRPSELARRRALAGGGFERLANLDYMERRNLRSAAAAPKALPSGYSLDRWSTRESSLLMDLLQRTFVGTLDCPGLASMRTSRDILEGHLQSGDGDTSLWRILRHQSNPVGAMLLSPSAATDSVDVIYLGLAPEARGAGLGAIMLSHGLAETAAHSAHFVQLAVDISNTPAVNLYRKAGFTTKQQREAWVCPLSSAASCPQ